MTIVADGTNPLYPGLPAHAEIANIEHDLTVLRERQTRRAVTARRLSATVIYGFWTMMAAGAAALVYAIATGNGDAGAKVFLVLLVLSILGACAWLFPNQGGTFAYWDHYPFRDDKEFLDHAIAVREARLRVLRVAR